ncbi:hypothetical protein B0H15DRAFT_822936 [Mycena belliarum]|uniref:PHD-type domain-containing protein n=1 Tax=Mycena belliarum TaxID=1033014 RepID=A0AAD6UB39_9AGAR|nr:hypothetical protein B0H15DRAFT_822936 [Mycena belliae]
MKQLGTSYSTPSMHATSSSLPRTHTCNNCKKNDGGLNNYLVTCADCDRSWHHRCLMPPIPNEELEKILTSYIATPGQLKLQWYCTKCSRRKKVAVRSTGGTHGTLGPAIPPSITATSPGLAEPWLNGHVVVSEIIDLTGSPEPRRPRRAQARAQVGEIIDLSEPESFLRAEVVIDISDSPPLVSPQSLGSPLPNLPAIFNDSSDIPFIHVGIDGVHSSVDSRETASPSSNEQAPTEYLSINPDRDPWSPNQSLTANPGRSKLALRGPSPQSPDMIHAVQASSSEHSRRRGPPSPRLSEFHISGTPSRSQTPDTIVRFPSMEVDEDVDQKPISLLLRSLTVSDMKGGTLGPSWMRERLKASEKMALWRRYAEKQGQNKPLSRRKPERTSRFAGRSIEPFILLPFVV